MQEERLKKSLSSVEGCLCQSLVLIPDGLQDFDEAL